MSMFRTLTFTCTCVAATWIVSVCLGAEAAPGQPAGSTGWSYFGGSKRMDRYSPLAQINRENLNHLQVLWTRPGLDSSITQQFPDLSPSPYLHGTPIMIDGVLYAPDVIGLVEAFDPMTGKTLWVQKPFKPTLKEAAGIGVRTVDLWGSGTDKRIVNVRGEYLYELDARTGEAITSFGDHGRVSLKRHNPDPPDKEPFYSSNGPIVVGDVIVVGGLGGGRGGGDGGFEADAAPEDIRGYDARTGQQLWQFHVLEHGATWGKGSDQYVGNMGAWGPLSADEELGIVYAPTSAPTNASYGGHRPGNNLYSDCLLAIDAKTGKLIWYFQMVHHDLWDYDNASPPTLGDITVDGKRIHAVMQPNKSAYLYVFDRQTGKPVWPIIERPAPQGLIAGEAASPTQPIPSKPPAFDRQGITENDLIDFTPALHAEALDIMRRYVTGPVFTPPSLPDRASGKKGSLIMPGAWGGGNWNTGAFDPDTGIYYAVSMTAPDSYGIAPLPANKRGPHMLPYGAVESRDERPAAYGIGPEGLPLVKPPYGRVTALDLNTGEKLWTIANGDGPRNSPGLKALNLPPLGTIGRPAALVTKTLLFLGESSNVVDGAGVSGEAQFFAYDKATGARLWQGTLPAGTTGGPITYEINGKQLIVVPVGREGYGTAWVALGLKP